MNSYSEKHRLLFLIRSLEIGGAERQLVELAKGLDKSRFHITIATFYPGGVLLPELASIEGVDTVCLQKRGRWDTLNFLGRLQRLVRQIQPHIVHGYLNVANEYALVAGKMSSAKVVWGLRASNVDFFQYDWTALFMFRIGAVLSRWADLILVNSKAGKEYHVHQGYWAQHMSVIPNGIDTIKFQPDPAARLRLGEEWGVGKDELLVGLAGRLDPIKDHPTFLRMAALLAGRSPRTRFICIGDGPQKYQQELRALGESLELGRSLIWAEARQDMPAVYNAMDILCSASTGEGFSNVIGEAMACGIPCVVTDVGDSKWIVGESGQAVPPRDPAALARACLDLLELTFSQRLDLGKKARERIMGNFSIEKMIASSEAAFTELILKQHAE